jgi:hypothetical protein
LKTLLLFGSGLVLWIIYGVLQKDVVIMLANGISLLILSAMGNSISRRLSELG